MNDTAARNLVKTTFENPYSRDRFLIFTKNLFHRFEPKTFVYRGKYIPDAYGTHVKTLERIGKFEDENSNKIDILAVQLKKPSSLEHARTMQRNFIAWYLNGSRGNVAKDAALVAFYTKSSDNWRLSLVKMDYSLAKSKAGKIKAITELTPARRFSFSVGKDENTHTAQRQLLPVLQKDDYPPVLPDLEEAFSVEVVTKDFFEKYKTLYHNTKEALDRIVNKDAKIKSDFTEKNIDTVDFTKKLLGQIVFLYFLQKKGWFGVLRGKDWGEGDKEFLRNLSLQAQKKKQNYFNKFLEPLFYEALAIERPKDYYAQFDCRIPFLNGGLFDPINSYDWQDTDILLPNEIFSNSTKTKEGDTGDGILDVFDRYNFTVKEDEPLEREVAVDPEMLGKVFENLLEVKDRKSKGTYYTPREIVHYMCQESLINYLFTEFDSKVKRDDIETLIRFGETAVEHDSRVVAHGKETKGYPFKLPQSIRKNASLIDESLENIKVCDPAVGSGAFLVGMMTEVIRARNTLSSYLPKNNRSIYAFKRHAIQNCLYGVDIDPGAVEIAKLRLWLSLIVDEQDIKQIKPLPNLDYKIMQGNSLLEEYEGIKLFDEDIVSTSPFDNTRQIEQAKEKLNELQREFFKLHSSGELEGNKKQQIEAELSKQNDLLKKLTKIKATKPENDSLFDQFSQAKKKADELKKLHQEFFEAAHKNRKDEIKKQIEALEWDLIETTLREQGKQSLLPEIERFKKANIKPFFLWKLNFSEVFEKNGGFDVVIANPPYITIGGKQEAKVERKLKEYFVRKFKSYEYKTNYFALFIEKSLRITKDKGRITYIVPRTLLDNYHMHKIRHLILCISEILYLVELKYKVFESGETGGNLILIAQKSDDVESRKKHLVKAAIWNSFIDYSSQKFNLIPQSTYLDDQQNQFLIVSDTLLMLLNKIKSQSEALGKLALIKNGVNTGNAAKILLSNTKKSEKYRKILEGKDINRYLARWNDLWVNYDKSLKQKIDLKTLETRQKKIDFSLRDEKIFNKEKIIVRQTADEIIAALDSDKYITRHSTHLILSTDKRLSNKYLLAVLNSKLITFYYRQIIPEVGKVFPEVKIVNLAKLPIFVAPKKPQQSLVDLVDKIHSLTKAEDYLENYSKQDIVQKCEKQIDQLVYKLYNLTPEEIKIVEKNSK